MHVRVRLQITGSANFNVQINSQKKRAGSLAPKKFVQRLKRDNEVFRSYQHQVSIIMQSHIKQHKAVPLDCMLHCRTLMSSSITCSMRSQRC